MSSNSAMATLRLRHLVNSSTRHCRRHASRAAWARAVPPQLPSVSATTGARTEKAPGPGTPHTPGTHEQAPKTDLRRGTWCSGIAPAHIGIIPCVHGFGFQNNGLMQDIPQKSAFGLKFTVPSSRENQCSARCRPRPPDRWPQSGPRSHSTGSRTEISRSRTGPRPAKRGSEIGEGAGRVPAASRRKAARKLAAEGADPRAHGVRATGQARGSGRRGCFCQGREIGEGSQGAGGVPAEAARKFAAECAKPSPTNVGRQAGGRGRWGRWPVGGPKAGRAGAAGRIPAEAARKPAPKAVDMWTAPVGATDVRSIGNSIALSSNRDCKVL
jgi:hypothetical protein